MMLRGEVGKPFGGPIVKTVASGASASLKTKGAGRQ
jgi:hypothetical protein